MIRIRKYIFKLKHVDWCLLKINILIWFARKQFWDLKNLVIIQFVIPVLMILFDCQFNYVISIMRWPDVSAIVVSANISSNSDFRPKMLFVRRYKINFPDFKPLRYSNACGRNVRDQNVQSRNVRDSYCSLFYICWYLTAKDEVF